MSIFKKGDKVFDHVYGWGLVEDNYSEEYPIRVNFGKHKCSYMVDGREFGDYPPTLSFTEYTLEGFSQERPEELPEKGQLVYVRDCDMSEWNMRYFSHNRDNYYYCFECQKKDGGTAPWKHLSIKSPLE